MTPDEIEDQARRARLSHNERRLFAYLATYKIATIEELIDTLYGDREDGGPENAEVSTRVTLYNMAKKVKPFARITPEKFYVYYPLPRAVEKPPSPE